MANLVILITLLLITSFFNVFSVNNVGNCFYSKVKSLVNTQQYILF